MSTEGRVWEKVLRLEKKNDGVMDDKSGDDVTLVRWDDPGEEMNHE